MPRAFDQRLDWTWKRRDRKKSRSFGTANVPLALIAPDFLTPRGDHGEVSEREQFLKSIRENGVMQEIVVHQEDDGRYRIIDGHRRFLAALHLGFETVPCVVMFGMAKGDQMFLAWEYNAGRWGRKPRNLSPEEELKMARWKAGA